jgi:hypothetical protein
VCDTDIAPNVSDDRRQIEKPAAGDSSAVKWGRLPAPWEPLPSWVTRQPSPEAATGLAHDRPRAATVRTAAGHRDDTSSNASAGLNAARARPEPDLDALARQVYEVLKRRLSIERRRSSWIDGL